MRLIKNGVTKSRTPRRSSKRFASSSLTYSGSMAPSVRVPRRMWKQNVVPITASVILPNISSTTTPQAGGLSFDISGLPDVASYTAIFDQYMINMLEIRFMSVTNFTNNPTTLATAPFNKLYTVIDFNDALPLSSIANALEYKNCYIHGPTSNVLRRFKPRITAAVYNGTTITASGNSDATWINTNTNNITHYGIKYVIEGSAASVISQFSVFVKFHLLFRNTR